MELGVGQRPGGGKGEVGEGAWSQGLGLRLPVSPASCGLRRSLSCLSLLCQHAVGPGGAPAACPALLGAQHAPADCIRSVASEKGSKPKCVSL